MRWLRSIRHPEGFHGRGRTRRFFEGWYVKLVSADRAHRWAVIPGLFLGERGDAESFVQVLDGTTGRSWYLPHPHDSFTAAEHSFDVRFGDVRLAAHANPSSLLRTATHANPSSLLRTATHSPPSSSPRAAAHFHARGITLDLDGCPLRGTLAFGPLTPWPVTLAAPGVMGWFGYVPFMECYHGVVSLHHPLSGALDVEGRRVDFTGGTGYIEKDWGEAFPSAYVWMQSNHFASSPGTSLVASIAIIPWLRSSFRGFLGGVWHHGRLHRFATWTGARTTALHIDDAHVTWSLLARDGARLDVRAERRRGGLLHAPVRTAMHRRVEETLDARLHVTLRAPGGRLLLDDTGECAGLEVHGDLDRLLRM